MLNKIWFFMIIASVVAAAFTGNLSELSNAAITGGKEAVSLSITMLGVVSVWCGIMRIGEKAGIIESITKRIMPLLAFLFPGVPRNHKALKYIAANFTANFLGLGWAATPAGLMAIKELDSLNRKKGEASNEMCMFMIINMSSLQLVSVNIIAYRAQYGSLNPGEVIGASIVATAVSTIIGIITAKICERLC